MPSELAYLAPSRVRDSIDSQATNSANALQADQPARPVQPARTAHAIVSATAPQFVSHRLTRHYPHSVAAPRAGELHLWRFRCEWLPVPVQEGETWMSKGERERARLHPNAALRKRFISARVVTRWIVANLFDCEPHTVDLQDDGNEKLRARHPHDGRGITIDIAYAGIWIVIGIASTTLGLSVAVPSPGAALDDTRETSRQRVRYGSLCNALRYAPVGIDLDLLSSDAASCAFDLAEHGRWHVLDLPMSGKIRAAVALAQPVTQVHAVGWPKALVFGERNV
ncbi:MULTISPECIES: hypothetical protein [Paraburkholderia]|uniref:Uncharacterized protein n=1 Tax=Paraburkholderia madseniana TaxID=2599607 RepID=A0AAP5BGT9_9BURK|nr:MULTISPECIES: hypothetical protein [Paraburkholderia]MCX4149256.1 hypothetical protein [Paraburkholderia madseniana]MDN7152191.1 hypothetical protein [Paraburkholderia sp. WS6]MDQ6411073.1 hypothetical protein [Paraburkholderia madseniana]